MQRYILRRIMLMIPTLFGLTFLVFVMVRLVPGDIVTLISGDFGATSPEVRAKILADFGSTRTSRSNTCCGWAICCGSTSGSR